MFKEEVRQIQQLLVRRLVRRSCKLDLLASCVRAPVKVKPLGRRRASGLSKDVNKAASGAMSYGQQTRHPELSTSWTVQCVISVAEKTC